MADENTDNTPKMLGMDELSMLKERAKVMGITHSNNIGVDALRNKIESHLNGVEYEIEDSEEEENSDKPNRDNPYGDDDNMNSKMDTVAVPKNETAQEMRDRLRLESLALVRVRISNMDPKKRDLQGEIFTVGNEFVGTIRKFVPYGEFTDEGYHIPKIIYDELNSRKFLNIRTSKKKGQTVIHQNWVKEFNLEILPPLTDAELKTLAASQMAAGGMDADTLN